jgi:hypothetical protein
MLTKASADHMNEQRETEMCRRLAIPGLIGSSYNLFAAVNGATEHVF